MSHPLRSTLPLVAALCVVLALGPAAVGGQVTTDPATGAGVTASASGPLCLGEVPATGALTVSPTGAGPLATLNVTAAGADPTVTVEDRGDGAYAIVVETDAGADARCPPASNVTVSRRLPADASRVVVVVNDRRVGSVSGAGATTLS